MRVRRTFPVDSRNENLPEKRIHQTCAGRDGRNMASDVFIARTRAAPRRRPERDLQVQAAVVGSVPLFPDCY